MPSEETLTEPETPRETTASSEAPASGSAMSEGSLLANRSYRLLLTGRTAEDLGAGIGAFAVPLLAYAITGSVVQAGAIAFVGQLGSVLMSLPAGVIVDRVDRRKLMVSGALVAALAWLSVVLAGVLEAIPLTGPHLAAALFVSSLVGSLMDPADTAALHAVVRKDQMGQAMSVAQGREAAVLLLAGPVGGLLYGMSTVLPFLVSAAGRLATVVTTSLVREPLNGDLEAAKAEHPLRSLEEGLRYVFAQPLFRAALPVFVLVNLVLNAGMSAIVLHLASTGTTPALIGVVNVAVGVGILAGSVLAGFLIRKVRIGVLTVMALGSGAGATVAMALFPHYWGIIAALTVLMLFAPALNAGLISYLTAVTPGHMQGRMAAAMGLSGIVSGPTAPLVGSSLLQGLGIGSAMWVFAAGWAVAFGAMFLVRPLWRIGLPDTWEDDAIEWPPVA